MRALLLPLAILLLTACGFQLAGKRALPAPLGTVYIAMATPYRVEEPPLQTALRRELVRRGANVEPRPEKASTHIRLWNLQEQRDTLSIGPDGKALEYRLAITVRYSVQQGAQPLVAENELTVRRDYSFSADQILAKEAEEAQLRAYIQGEMAELLLLRIEAALAGSAPQ